jgi:hypothetical protein
MKHAREDYNRIQDPAGLIPEDEPVFLIRGQDKAGPETLRYWADNAHLHGASEEIIQRALNQAEAMEAWQTKKTPDL